MAVVGRKKTWVVGNRTQMQESPLLRRFLRAADAERNRFVNSATMLLFPGR